MVGFMPEAGFSVRQPTALNKVGADENPPLHIFFSAV
jgi:hypothetical protein